MDGWIFYPASKSDKGWFGCLSYQSIGWLVCVLVGQFAGRKDSQTGLCLIPSPKILLNWPGQFTCQPDIQFSQRANCSEYIYKHKRNISHKFLL